MKSEKILRTLSIKVKHKSVLIHDKSQNFKVFDKPILFFFSSPKFSKEINSSYEVFAKSKTFYFAGIEREEMYKKWLINKNKVKSSQIKQVKTKTKNLMQKRSCANTLFKPKLRLNKTSFLFATHQKTQDYRILTLRSCNLFSKKTLFNQKLRFWYGRQKTTKLIRPLLDFKRESITIICKDLCVSVYPDKSNRLLQYSRNRIRKQIIPSIKYFLNPQVENSLFKIAELLKREQSLIYSLLKNTSVNTP